MVTGVVVGRVTSLFAWEDTVHSCEGVVVVFVSVLQAALAVAVVSLPE